ncbi:choloylglycine hydrolase family protein [Parasphingopyxis sp.]|uniref:choloylglycine hydrolase family protein n=1 Tax=Parasphingopyxis sp. TaxID=1920299 RepID=UPI0026261B5E|nr:choloylglycine hydrolase family protein [Parasphingopyxis sp.]
MKTFTYLAKAATFATAAVLMTPADLAEACTGITLRGADGTVVRARTMEWASFDLEAEISVFPRGYQFTADNMPDGHRGRSWEARYGMVATTGMGRPVAVDGINEAGLSAGAFYLPGFSEFPPFDPADAENTIAPTDVVAFVLAQYATLDEVREGLDGIRVAALSDPSLGFPAPLHTVVTDRQGNSIVIEIVEQEMRIHDAPLGVITNSPTYDWHMTNLRNYLNLSGTALPHRTAGEIDFAPLGAGSGMLGLPGDFTPPSRFVRAVAFTQNARPTEGGFDTVRESFRILDNFNVPVEAVANSEHAQEANLVLSATQFTTAADTRNLRFYYHTMHNRQLRMVDLNEIDFANIGTDVISRPVDPGRDPGVETLSLVD